MEGKILIVDDDLDTLQLVGTMLEKQGFTILAANDGTKALLMAPKEIPDLIILDIMMPDIDGYEVTRRLREMPETAYIPIILFTAKAQVDDKVEGFEAGADDYLTKPTHPAELIARVQTILSRPKAEAPAVEDTAEFKSKGQVIGVISAKGGLGVSTLAVNLGVSIHTKTNDFVTVAELQPGRGDIGIYLGYTLSPEGLNNLLRKDSSQISLSNVEDQLITHGSGIQLLLSSFQPQDANLMCAVEEFKVIVNHLSRLSPYLVLDLGSGMPGMTKEAVHHCDELVVLVEPYGYNLIQTKALLEDLKQNQFNTNSIHLVLFNRVRMEISVPVSQIQAELGQEFAGVITPAPELAYQATVRMQPLVLHQPESLTAQQITKLAQNLITPVPAGR